MAQTVQQRFDAAQAKMGANDHAGALAELQSLEAHLRAQPKPSVTNIAITQAQQAEALMKLGRGPEAKERLRLALNGDALSRPALSPVREKARLSMAQIMEAELDHAGAREAYLKLAEEGESPVMRVVALMGAARSTMFTDAAQALGHVDRGLALIGSDPSIGKEELANVTGLKGRILLNAGRFREAEALLVKSVDLRGGLDRRVDQQDIALRADAATALLNLNAAEKARRYLAYAGAGRTENALGSPVEMPLPSCTEHGLDPNESAIVEFTILNDGRVVAARPIYASRQGDSAYIFTRAVERWSWDPARASKVNPFFRASTRVELRCSNALPRPEPITMFELAVQNWLAAQGVAAVEGTSSAAIVPALSTRLERAAPDSVERLAMLILLSRNKAVERTKRREYAAEAERLARSTAPDTIHFQTALEHAELQSQDGNAEWRGQAAKRLALFSSLRSRPEFAGAAMQAILNLEIAQAAGILKRGDVELEAITAVVQDERLSAKDPLKVAALLQLANLHAARNELSQAQTVYGLTGLSAQQCALLDSGRVMLEPGRASFPRDALIWGFEGWTSQEFDVGADGRTRNVRAVASFPPRVFVKASEEPIKTSTYRVSYRPDGDLACTGMRRNVVFMIPDAPVSEDEPRDAPKTGSKYRPSRP